MKNQAAVTEEVNIKCGSASTGKVSVVLQSRDKCGSQV